MLIGRENESAATVLVQMLDAKTRPRPLESRPPRADPFICPCQDLDLPITGYVFSVPKSRYGSGDSRAAVIPDIW